MSHLLAVGRDEVRRELAEAPAVGRARPGAGDTAHYHHADRRARSSRRRGAAGGPRARTRPARPRRGGGGRRAGAGTQVWPHEGVPANPQGWLLRTARNRAVDLLRREDTLRVELPALAQLDVASAPQAGDDELALMLLCCYPSCR